ncbi:hypothetical protein LCGC14_2983970 [marine sediment metagenome]|uniref:Uncharacterized protein n=1 Tax=marine sediment metagenome TaxID=412755 RepID=A0A0F8ZWX4_9ZZZZ
MSLKPVQPEEQVIKACQVGLTVISSEGTAIPGNLLDGTASFKNLLIGIIQGNLFICQKEVAAKEGEQQPEKGPAPPAEVVKTPKKTVRKKVSKKVASKKA